MSEKLRVLAMNSICDVPVCMYLYAYIHIYI